MWFVTWVMTSARKVQFALSVRGLIASQREREVSVSHYCK